VIGCLLCVINESVLLVLNGSVSVEQGGSVSGCGETDSTGVVVGGEEGGEVGQGRRIGPTREHCGSVRHVRVVQLVFVLVVSTQIWHPTPEGSVLQRLQIRVAAREVTNQVLIRPEVVHICVNRLYILIRSIYFIYLVL